MVGVLRLLRKRDADVLAAAGCAAAVTASVVGVPDQGHVGSLIRQMQSLGDKIAQMLGARVADVLN
jgi:hypothetical protein